MHATLFQCYCSSYQRPLFLPITMTRKLARAANPFNPAHAEANEAKVNGEKMLSVKEDSSKNENLETESIDLFFKTKIENEQSISNLH